MSVSILRGNGIARVASFASSSSYVPHGHPAVAVLGVVRPPVVPPSCAVPVLVRRDLRCVPDVVPGKGDHRLAGVRLIRRLVTPRPQVQCGRWLRSGLLPSRFGLPSSHQGASRRLRGNGPTQPVVPRDPVVNAVSLAHSAERLPVNPLGSNRSTSVTLITSGVLASLSWSISTVDAVTAIPSSVTHSRRLAYPVDLFGVLQ